MRLKLMYFEKDDGYSNAVILIKEVLKRKEKISQKRRLEVYEDYLPLLIERVETAEDYLSILTGERKGENENKKWDANEDNLLVELAAKLDNNRFLGILGAMMFDRSSTAVLNRLSQLVGKTRTEQKIQGSFTGTFNDEFVKGQLSGLLQK